LRCRLVAHANDMRKEDRQTASAQPAPLGAGSRAIFRHRLHLVADARPSEHHMHQDLPPQGPDTRPSKQEGRKLHIKRRPARAIDPHENSVISPKFQALMTVPPTLAITIAQRAWNGKWAQKPPQREQSPGNRRVETGRPRQRHSTAQQIAPVMPSACSRCDHPCGNHAARCTTGPLTPRRAARGQRDQRGRANSPTLLLSTRPSFSAAPSITFGQPRAAPSWW